MLKKIIFLALLMLTLAMGSYAASVNLITSIQRSPTNATAAQNTNGTSVSYKVTFNTPVSGVNTGSFAVTVTGSATYTIASVTTVSSTIYTVVVNSISVTGASATLRLDLIAGGNGITKISNGDIPTAYTASVGTYIVDQTAPLAPTLTYPNSTLTSNGTVNVQLQLSESNPKSSTVILKFTDATTTSNVFNYTLSVANGALTIFTFNINNVVSTSSGQIVSASPSATLPSGTYTVTLTFQDQAGNTSATTTQSNVFINNNPTFTGVNTMSFCDNSSNNDVTSNLVVRDLDNGQTLTWNENSSPNAHGTLSGLPATRTSNGGNRTPTALSISYTPDAGFIGDDSFSISVDDGLGGTSSKVFYVTVNETKAYYHDVDADTYGDINARVFVCTGQPTNYVFDSTDCDDNASSMHAKYPFYQDNDHDGYGINTIDSVCAVNASTPPSNSYSNNNTDCNDVNILVWQSSSLYIDVDADGYDIGTSTQCYGASLPAGYASLSSGSDCNDGDNTMHATFSFYVDADNDTYGSTTASTQCAVNNSTPPSGYSTNNTDCNDAQDSVWHNGSLYIDADHDGYDNGSALVCYGNHVLTGYAFTTLGTDCDDNNSLLTTLITYYQDADNDGYGTNDFQTTACSLTPPLGYVANNTDCDDANVNVHTNSVVVSVSITIFPSVIAYTGHSVTLTASPTNGGTPSYQWIKNNIAVATSSANTYTYIPANGDVIKCVLTSSLKCTISPTDTSNAISIIVTNPPLISNDYPCGAINCSSNSGHIAGLPTVISAFDNGGSVYAGLDNSKVDNNPPVGPSLVYYNMNCTAAGSIGDPISSCQISGSQNSVWYKFKAPSFTAGVTIRSKLSYGQLFIPVLTAYAITAGTPCNSPTFSEIQCSSNGVLALNSSTLSPYSGQYIYVMIQNSSTEPICNYVVSIQGIVPDITLSNPTTTTIDVNFPSFTLPTPTKYTLYWRKVGSNGASYINLAPTSTYTIGGLISGNNYDVWVKYSNASTGGTSNIYSSKQTLGTTVGCGGNLPAPTISANGSHCASVIANWTNPPASIPSNLLSPITSYPYRLLWMRGTRGNVQALQTIAPSGYYIGNLTMGQLYNVFYSYKCIGGAIMYSAVSNYTTCVGTPRIGTSTEHHEYIINNVHYVDVDIEDVLAAATYNIDVSDGLIHEFTLNEVTNDNTNDNMDITSAGNFEILPNPATNNVIINYNFDNANTRSIKYQIVDIQGKLVAQSIINEAPSVGSINIDLAQFEQGVYIVSMQTNGFSLTKKLVVIK